jgi:hypothetical protein
MILQNLGRQIAVEDCPQALRLTRAIFVQLFGNQLSRCHCAGAGLA